MLNKFKIHTTNLQIQLLHFHLLLCCCLLYFVIVVLLLENFYNLHIDDNIVVIFLHLEFLLFPLLSIYIRVLFICFLFVYI